MTARSDASRRIALSQRVEVLADRGERRDSLDQRWSGLLRTCDLLPLPIANDPAALQAYVARELGTAHHHTHR